MRELPAAGHDLNTDEGGEKMMDVSMALDIAVGQAYDDAGVPPNLRLACRSLFPFARSNKSSGIAQRWKPRELQFLRENIGIMTDEMIAAALCRSIDAVKIKRQRRGMPAHSKRPGYLTGNGAANVLGTDIHAIMRMVEMEVIPHYIWPGGRNGQVIMISQQGLYYWAMNPMNWIYFRHEQVSDRRLRRMLELRRKRWDDDWWMPGQVAEYHNCSVSLINKYTNMGKFPRAKRWGNWWILRSEAQAIDVNTGRGSGNALQWTTAEDAFMLLGRAVGLSFAALDAMRGNPSAGRVAKYRVPIVLQDPEYVRRIMDEHDLDMYYDDLSGLLWDDWRRYPGRFPRMESAMGRFLSGDTIDRECCLIVNNVLSAWDEYYGGKQRTNGLSGRWSLDAQREYLRKRLARLRENGADL